MSGSGSSSKKPAYETIRSPLHPTGPPGIDKAVKFSLDKQLKEAKDKEDAIQAAKTAKRNDLERAQRAAKEANTPQGRSAPQVGTNDELRYHWTMQPPKK